MPRSKSSPSPPSDPEAVLACLQARLRQDPDDLLAYYELALVHRLRGQAGDMAAVLRRLLARHPDLALARLLLGVAYADLGRPTKARIEARTGLRQIQESLAQAADAATSAAPAAASLDEYKQLYPEDPNLAEVKFYQKAAEANQTNFEQAFLLGLAYKRLGWYYAAIESFRKVLKLKGDHHEAHFELGNTYKHLGKLPEAVRAYQQAVRLNPEEGEVRFQLGLTLLKQGQADLALQEYEVLKRLDATLAAHLLSAIREKA